MLETYDSGLTSGAEISVTDRGTQNRAPAVVTDANNPATELWWMYPGPWGITQGDGTLSMTYSGTGTITVTANLTNLNPAPVNAYPFVLYGCDPWNDCVTPSQAPTFPMQLSQMNQLLIDTTYALSGTQFTGDITYDEYLSDTAAPNGNNELEIMVMYDFAFGYSPNCPYVKSVIEPVLLNGVSTTRRFDGYFCTGGSKVTWIIEPDSYLTQGEIQINLLDLLRQGAAIGGKTPLAYLDGIQFGTEFGNSATQNFAFKISRFDIKQLLAP